MFLIDKKKISIKKWLPNKKVRISNYDSDYVGVFSVLNSISDGVSDSVSSISDTVTGINNVNVFLGSNLYSYFLI